MPSVNIYTSRERVKSLEQALPELRDFTAQELSCGSRRLSSDEISLRVIVPDSSMQIADTELEIKAHSYPERVEKQDAICRTIRDYVHKICPSAGSLYVWLQLSELGHSA